MAQRFRAFDWSATPLGPVSGWPAQFKSDIEEKLRGAGSSYIHGSVGWEVFLLTLSDALRPLDNPIVTMEVASRLLGEHLGVDRVAYAELAPDGEHMIVRRDWTREGVISVAGVRRVMDFGPFFRDAVAKGKTATIEDAALTAGVSSEEYERTWAAIGVRAAIAHPILKAGRLIAAFVIHSAAPRQWSAADITLVAEVAERTWAAVERARVEAALRESETRLAAVLEVLPVGVGVLDTDGKYVLTNKEMDRFLPTRILPSRDAARGWRWRSWDAEGNLVKPHDYPGARSLRGERVVPGMEFLYKDDDDREIWTNVAAVPLTQDGAITGQVTVISDIDLTKRSSEALRESEERFQQYARASSDVLWIRDARTLEMEYLSPAFEAVYGAPLETLLGKGPQAWAAIIVPEDRQSALAGIEQARRAPVVHEFRIIRPSDGSFRWIRNTDFPLFDSQGRVEYVAGIATDMTEARQAIEHQNVLLAELQHRVRNIMAMMRSISARTADSAASAEDYAKLIGGRLLTLARVQALLTRAANAGVEIGALIADELEAQAEQEDQYTIEGPSVMLSPKAAEALTLAVHELTTNALKYGALSAANAGALKVAWRVDKREGGPCLIFDWTETLLGAARGKVAKRRGFGTELIEGRIPYELGGVSKLTVTPDQVHCHIAFALKEGASILETGAPDRQRIFGGALDMTGEPDLNGQRILIVEDDFLLAGDAARALRGAGAEVIGPFPDERTATNEIQRQAPTAAIIDINLGEGPAFNLARALAQRQVPFLFMTGYDANVIPEEFAHIERVQKPVELRQVVRSFARLLQNGKAN